MGSPQPLSLFDWRPPTDSAVAVRGPGPRGNTHSRPAESAESRALSRDPDGLRPYQRECFSRIFENLSVNQSAVAVLATGLGKTVIFGAVAKHWHGRVLVIAHRAELLKQAREKLEAATNERVGLEQASEWAGQERVVVGSVQTLGTRKAYRRERFKRNPFGLIVIDECHHAPSQTYRAVIDAFPDAKILGVTATPDRGDQIALGKVFESTAYVRDYLEGRDDGYLVPVTALTIELGQVNLERIKAPGNADLPLGALEKEMQKGLERIAAKTVELAADRKTIVFVPGVEMAHLLAATFNRDRTCAVVVDGKTPAEERASLLARHARGEVQYLVNCGIATEGYDCPGVSCVAIARPTKSRALYAQMAGRGGRVLPGLVEGIDDAADRRAAIAASAKPDMLLLDFVGQAGKHKLVSPVDVLGGRDVDDETMAQARNLIKKRALRPDEAVFLAKDQIRRDREAREAAIRGLRATVRADAHRVDPFGDRPDFDEDGRPFYAKPVKDLPFLRGRPMSGALRHVLGSMGFTREAVEAMDHAAGVRALRKEKVRQSRGLATRRQLGELARYGLHDQNMYASRASELIEAHRRNGGRPLAPAQMAAIMNRPRAAGEEG